MRASSRWNGLVYVGVFFTSLLAIFVGLQWLKVATYKSVMDTAVLRSIGMSSLLYMRDTGEYPGCKQDLIRLRYVTANDTGIRSLANGLEFPHRDWDRLHLGIVHEPHRAQGAARLRMSLDRTRLSPGVVDHICAAMDDLANRIRRGERVADEWYSVQLDPWEQVP